MKIDIYEKGNKKIIASLEKGVVPWKRPWKGVKTPQSMGTKKVHEGISPETFDNSSAYIACWLVKLKSEKKWLVSSFGQAFKAVNHIKGIEVMAKESKVA